MDKISAILTKWYTLNKRNLPWRHSKSAYSIWLSEIIMQQTQVVQGTPYYIKFITEFPTIKDLANAPEDKVMALWQGLGYYSRARNLHETAKIVTSEYNGIFPSDPLLIIKLKGIGQYTCAAISTFAFDNPIPLVDGNVFRLYSRLFEIPTEINTPKGQKEFNLIAQKFLDIQTKEKAIIFNQAIMEFGALVCKPKTPNCNSCLLQPHCLSYKNNTQLSYPCKKKSKKKEEREIHYLLLHNSKGIWTANRKEKDIWQGLNELFLLKDRNTNYTIPIEEDYISKNMITHIYEMKHSLSHQNLKIKFHILRVKKQQEFENMEYRKWDELKNIGFPKPIVQFLQKNFPNNY